MVIMTAKVSKSKRIAAALIVLIAVILLVVCLSNTGKTPRSTNRADTAPAAQPEPSEIKTNDAPEPTQTLEVRIPTEPSEVFERYNDLQRSQGFDLSAYAGKNVRRYVYEIKNYPDSGDTYYATLFIYKNAVIGGDVCSSAQGGTMHGLCMPK